MHKTNGCYFLLMPFLQITRGTSPKKDIKILFCRVLTCTPRMKHVLLGEIFTPRGALGSLRSRLVTQRSLKFLGEERCVTRQKRLQRRLRVTQILMESCWFWVWLILHPHTRHATPRCAVKRSINWTNPATAGDPNSVVLKMFERNQFRVNSFTLTIFQL